MIESEKLLERKLSVEVKRAGGWSIKLLPFIIKGLPDRMVLFPKGRIAFVEMKTTGEKAKPHQELIGRKLQKLGFRWEVIDTTEKIKDFIKDYE